MKRPVISFHLLKFPTDSAFRAELLWQSAEYFESNSLYTMNMIPLLTTTGYATASLLKSI